MGDDDLSAILLSHHGLHIEIQIDRNHYIGKDSAAGVKDVVMVAVCALLIVLENDFPEVFSVESDGEPTEWQPALDWVNATLRDKAYEHPAGVVPVRASTGITE